MARRAGERPNILWIFADELRADALGCYRGGLGPTHTPNIDRLAAAGTLFRNHFCNSTVCVSSRTSILTATPPQENGVHGNEGAWASFPLPVRLDTFPEFFARNGWRTATLGKSHVPKDYKPWQAENHDGASMHGFGLDTDPAGRAPIVPQGIPSPVGGVFPDREFFPPEAVTINAIDWLDAAGDQPFLLRVSYLQPHTPVLPPARFRKMFRAEDYPGHDIPRADQSAFDDAFAAMVGGRELTHEQMRRAQADYHALVAWLDVQIGMVLAKLDMMGLRRNTIVVLDADHGASLGENGLLSKIVFAPQSQRVPRIISWPGRVPEGAARDDVAQSMDLARTLCHLAGVTPPDGFRGRALFSDPVPDAIYASVGSGEKTSRASAASNKGTWRTGAGWPRRGCIRTDRWRLDMNIRIDGGAVPPGEEDVFLADWRADPHERHNLADVPANAAIRTDLERQLKKFMARSREPDFVPVFSTAESPEFLPPRIAKS